MPAAGGTGPAEARIERSIRLSFQGDWGMANLHKVCGWLSQQVVNRTGPYSRTAIWNGVGWADAPLAVGRGEVDVALATPAHFAPMALEGRGPFAGEAFPDLRALGVVPQWDRLVLAVPAELGVASLAELRERRPALRITTCPDDGVNFIGYAAHRILDAAGVTREELERWGGGFVEHGHPRPTFARMLAGEADAIFQEAIMLPAWQRVVAERKLSCVPIDDEILSALERELGWRRAVLPAGYFATFDHDLQTLDFSDFIVLCRADLPDDVAHLLAWCLGETHEQFENWFRHIPVERSPVTYPLDPVKMGQTPIPLHPGAARYYEAL